MEKKLWLRFIQILSYRGDLLNIINPFFENLKNNNTNEEFKIYDEKYISFLKSLPNYQLNLLYQYKIIDDERYSTLRSKKTISDKKKHSLNPNEEIVREIIKADKVQELQKLILEKDINTIDSIITKFMIFNLMKIPIIIYSIIENSTQCFKYLLLNGIGSPTSFMEEENPDPNDKNWKSSHKFDWDCMSTAIYYGRVEIVKILEENGITKGSKPEHLEAAILSYRNGSAKEIINQMIENDEIKAISE